MNILDFIFPKKCLGCDTNGRYICSDCLEKVPQYGWVDSNYSIFRYKGVIRKAIISLKYKFAYDIAWEISDICVSKIRSLNLKKTVLVPIPLHLKRLKWRGFNQTEIICERLAKKMNWIYVSDLLIRTKKSKPQVGLKGLERQINLLNVFSVNPNYSKFKNHSIVVFDDVYTTGSTINEAKKELTKIGFKNLKSITIAR